MGVYYNDKSCLKYKLQGLNRFFVWQCYIAPQPPQSTVCALLKKLGSVIIFSNKEINITLIKNDSKDNVTKLLFDLAIHKII